jgi:hypothetical protein
VRVDGRRADTLKDSEGNAVPGIVLHVLLSDARREVIRQFQAVQRDTGDVILRVVRGREFSDDALAAITRRFEGYLRGLPVSVEFHEAIPPHVVSGKIKTIIVERTGARPTAA